MTDSTGLLAESEAATERAVQQSLRRVVISPAANASKSSFWPWVRVGAGAFVAGFETYAACHPDLDEECKRRIEEIFETMSVLEGRMTDLYLDRHNLKNLAPNKPSPALPKGSGSWNGHVQKIEEYQRTLQRLIKEAVEKGCEVPPFAWKLAYAPSPLVGPNMSYRVDGLSMLLSSDWFIPAWQICGLSTHRPIRQQIRIGCRKIVTDLLAGEDSYWNVEFSDARQQVTEQRFFDCLVRCRADDHDINIFRQLISVESGVVESRLDQALISTLLALLASEYPKDEKIQDGISSNIFSVVSSSIGTSNGLQEIKFMAGQANTEWDIWLNKIAGDVPRFLINVAQDIYDACDGFSRSWATINDKLHVDEQELLVGWLNKWGLLLADKLAVVPK